VPLELNCVGEQALSSLIGVSEGRAIGGNDGDWFYRLRNLCLVARPRKYWSEPSTTLCGGKRIAASLVYAFQQIGRVEGDQLLRRGRKRQRRWEMPIITKRGLKGVRPSRRKYEGGAIRGPD